MSFAQGVLAVKLSIVTGLGLYFKLFFNPTLLPQIEDRASKTKATICRARHHHAIAFQEFNDEPDTGVYGDVWVVVNEIEVSEARMEGIRLRTRVSQRATRERLLIRNQHDNIITHARQNRNHMKVCENAMPTCVLGCICLQKSKRLTGNIATNIVLGEQYYCHHGSKGYHLVTACLGILSNIRINQIYTPRRNKWSIRWIDGDLTDTHERPVTKFIIVDAHNIELVANSELVF